MRLSSSLKIGQDKTGATADAGSSFLALAIGDSNGAFHISQVHTSRLLIGRMDTVYQNMRIAENTFLMVIFWWYKQSDTPV